MTRWIRLKPLISKQTLSADQGQQPFPLNDSRSSFWYDARTAIWQGIQRLGLRRGSRILVPAYSCGSEIDVLSNAGLILEYYRIQKDLTPHFDHLRELTAKPAAALFIIHYFGFPQPMRQVLEFTAQHNLMLIEDNAHGFYSNNIDGTPLGSVGDMSVFSFRKPLPLPDGGSLFIRQLKHNTECKSASQHPARVQTLERLAALARPELSRLVPAIKKIRSKKNLRHLKDKPSLHDLEAMRFQSVRAEWSPSTISRYLLRHVDHNAIRDTRIRNYSALNQSFEGGTQVKPLMPSLPQGCCPWFYPVWAEDPLHVMRHLLQKMVECSRFWLPTHPKTPMLRFDFEKALRHHVLVLPIHQDLDLEDMSRIVDALNSSNRQS